MLNTQLEDLYEAHLSTSELHELIKYQLEKCAVGLDVKRVQAMNANMITRSQQYFPPSQDDERLIGSEI